jgi:signal peptidase I
MEPNLLVGDHLLVNKFVFSPHLSAAEDALLPIGRVGRGDVVVFKYPEEPERDFIKRVIGLPGETLEVRDGRVLIDGRPIDEPYLEQARGGSRMGELDAINPHDRFGPVTVPEGHYFVMGDNRDNSQDSRYWGSLPATYLKGKALIIYWSYEVEPAYVPSAGLGETVRRVASTVVHFFTRTRWDRMFRQIQ